MQWQLFLCTIIYEWWEWHLVFILSLDILIHELLASSGIDRQKMGSMGLFQALKKILQPGNSCKPFQIGCSSGKQSWNQFERPGSAKRRPWSPRTTYKKLAEFWWHYRHCHPDFFVSFTIPGRPPWAFYTISFPGQEDNTIENITWTQSDHGEDFTKVKPLFPNQCCFFLILAFR